MLDAGIHGRRLDGRVAVDRRILGTYASTSAMATRTLMLPFGSRSATSIWSRSFEVSLSIEDHSSVAGPGSLRAGATRGACDRRSSSCPARRAGIPARSHGRAWRGGRRPGGSRPFVSRESLSRPTPRCATLSADALRPRAPCPASAIDRSSAAVSLPVLALGLAARARPRRHQSSVSGRDLHRSHGDRAARHSHARRPDRPHVARDFGSSSRRTPVRAKSSARRRSSSWGPSARRSPINAHYFWPLPSAEPESSVLGIGASEGDVYSSFESLSSPTRCCPTRRASISMPPNHATIVHRDPSQPDGRHVREPVALWTTFAGSAQIVTDGVVTIPKVRRCRTSRRFAHAGRAEQLLERAIVVRAR